MTYDQAKTKFARITPSWKNNYKALFLLSEAAAKDKRVDNYSRQSFIKAMKDVREEDYKIIRPGSV